MPVKKVAIAGAGLAGLGLAWHLAKRGVEVVLYDPRGIAGGASGISTGLLHPFPGKKALRSWMASDGMAATRELLAIAGDALAQPVFGPRGIFRPAVTVQQQRDFQACAGNNSEAQWREMPEFGAGLWIESGMTVYSRSYLQGLWKACEREGARLIQEKMPLDIEDADQIVLATGFETLQFPNCRHLPLKATIGQTLLCRWEKPLPFSLVSQGHITPTEDPAFCQVGSTYEHTLAPDPKVARELLSKTALFYPSASSLEIVEIRSGVRITRTEGYRPIAEKIGPKTWVFTGLGSRGMLYHALIGQYLAAAIVEQQEYVGLPS